MAAYTPPTIQELMAKLTYLGPDELILVRRAYDVAEQAHRGQKRSSGEDYVTHPLAVTDILADLHSDAETLAAGLLHDVVEDCEITPEQLEEQFGLLVRRMVVGVTKLSKDTRRELEPTDNHGNRVRGLGSHGDKLPLAPTRQNEWAENMRQLFMSSVDHPLILVIKLADRLHNMRTLQGHPREDKRRRIAQETMNIFAPVANRLGMWQIKWELEDLAFRHLQPEVYQDLKDQLNQRRRQREQFVQQVIELIQADLQAAGIKGEVTGRPKHIYSIWRKMQRKGIPFEKVYDIHGFRVLVEGVGDCYSVLGLIHNRWMPIPGEFDDYIARPKENGYQSLHTAVVGPSKVHMEVQIRTHEMHQLAEQGVAAHWRYKEGGQKHSAEFANKVAWLRALMSYEEDTPSAAELMEDMREDLFGDRVYVFTPAGDLLSLPAGATPIDFAYRIHTEVGNRCRGARVNGKLVRLDHQLKNRDQVEIITAKRGGPSRDWLNKNLGFVKTRRARAKIKAWFRKQDRDLNIAAGRQALDRLLKQLNLRSVSFEQVAKEFENEYDDLEDFLAAIGYGDISIEHVTGKVLASQNKSRELSADDRLDLPEEAPAPTPVNGTEVRVLGVEGLLTRLAQCCNPSPGQPIIGYVTRGRGVTIHRADCPNVINRVEPERLIHVEWGGVTPTHPVPLLIQAWNRAGLLRDIAGVVAAEGVNISTTSSDASQKNPTAQIHLTLNVKDAHQLARLITRLGRVPSVISVERARSSL
ncbi:MAG: bifunctional (p)ppGpp synthetase/guanosine-3',5'-bis(diphosphate) 3'-pyrophosphohydrolase [Chloroflexi bacterium]|nr:bifunctional (p)ppGpp synthetase/guanosine-3',5'-bis(diphosphate) 3'-pyrophosphohydrolase [Chloroflexota bacterium]